MTPDHYTYRISWSADDQEYVATCAEFPSLSWLAEDEIEALHGIKRLVGDVVADMRAGGELVPEPLAERRFSGKFQVRTTPELHRRLAIEAAEAKVSLNRLINSKLSTA
jgi:predicted HicB family RNase H-like nuclease